MTFIHRVYNKLEVAAARLFTASIKGSFGVFGRGSLVFPPNNLANVENMYFGDRVRILARCWIMTIQEWDGRQYGGRLEIGDNSTILYDVQISACSRVTIGRNVCVSRGSVIVDHLHDYRIIDQPIALGPLTEGRPIVIEDDTFIGVNCVIAPGVHIGKHVFIGANSVVTKDIPSYSMVAGAQAQIIRRYDFNTEQWIAA